MTRKLSDCHKTTRENQSIINLFLITKMTNERFLNKTSHEKTIIISLHIMIDYRLIQP